MDLVIHGLDKGAKPVQFVEHLYRLVGDDLVHFTDGQLRATVPPEGFVAFVADHPEAAALLLETVPEINTLAGEFKLARAKELAAVRQKVSPGADQKAIDKIVEAAIAKALERFVEIQRKQLAGAGGAT